MNIKGTASLKKRFPFRLGTTSYIIPADLISNVRFLADKVDDVELVLFESEEITNLPDACTVEMLKETAERHDLTYSVHLPLDTWMGHEDESTRRQSVDKCLRVIEVTAPLSPFTYVVHFHTDPGESPSRDLARWTDNHRRSVERLLQDVSSRDLCVETLDYDYGLIEDIVSDYGLAVCLDIGHLLLYGHRPEEYLDRYLPQTRIIHLHGVEDGNDHRGLASFPSDLLTSLVGRLEKDSKKSRVLTMELFDEKAFNQSLDILTAFAR